MLVRKIRESRGFAIACAIYVAMSRGERNCPNDAACGDHLIEKMLNHPDFVDSGRRVAACPIALLVSIIVGTPGDDGAVRRRVARLNFGEDTVDLSENIVQRSTVLQMDLPMIAGIKNGYVLRSDVHIVCGGISKVLDAHERRFLLSRLVGKLTGRIAEDSYFVALFELGLRRR